MKNKTPQCLDCVARNGKRCLYEATYEKPPEIVQGQCKSVITAQDVERQIAGRK